MHKGTLFGLLAAVLFAGSFYAVLRMRDEPASGVPGPESLLFNLDPEKVDWLAVETPAWRVECRKVRGRWRMERPLQGAADLAVVERILGELALLPREDVITPAQMEGRRLTPADYGLEAPSVVIAVGSGASPPHTLQIGSLAPFPSSVFVRRGDETAVVVTRTNILAALPREAGDFRDRRLLEGNPASVLRLDLERRSSAFVQVSQEGGWWRLLQPVADRADARRVHAWLADLLAVEVREVIANGQADPAAYGLGTDSLEAVLTLWQAGDREPTRLEIGHPLGAAGDRVYARIGGSGPILATDPALLKLLAFRVQDWRDPVRLPLQPEGVRGLVLEVGERRLTAWREPAGWHLAEPRRAPGDAERIEAFLSLLREVRAVGFEEGGWTNGPLAQVGVWTGMVIEASAAAPDFRFRLLEPTDGDRFRADTGTGAVFLVEGSLVRRLFGEAPYWDPLRFRDRAVLSVSTAAVKRVSLTRGERVDVVERDPRGRWLAPDGRTIRPDALDGILRTAALLRADRLEMPDEEAARHGFNAPAARLELGLDGDGGIQRTLVLGGLDPQGGRYARVQGEDVVFVLAPGEDAVLMRGLLE